MDIVARVTLRTGSSWRSALASSGRTPASSMRMVVKCTTWPTNLRSVTKSHVTLSPLTIFQEHFKQRLSDAMQKIPAPKQTIKLTMSSQQQRQSQDQKPSGIKLRLGGNKNSPAPNASAPGTPGARSSSTPGVIVDNDALERQQRHVQAGINGQRPPSSGGPVRNPLARRLGVHQFNH